MRPWLQTYSGIRIDKSEELWSLYLKACGTDDGAGAARKLLYSIAGSGGWDDICLHCPNHRYEHQNLGHSFISEEQ